MPPAPGGAAGAGPDGGTGPAGGGLGRSSTVMALGSLASRATGFVRSAVIVAALGTALLGDAYQVANTVPNILYFLLIGGALNAVLVPQLVRAAREHADRGAAYTDRLLTACTAALLLVTAAAVVAAPWLVTAYAPQFTGAQRDLTVAFARCCLPQILCYGLFTLLGQVLNARGRFGAMMWTPVLNNVVVIAVFGLYLAIAAQVGDAAGMSRGQVLLLGLGSTAGVLVQTVALVPALRAAGFRFRPRFDWRDSGLAAPLRAAVWTVLLVLVNQAAYWVVTSLSTSAAVRAAAEGIAEGVGFTAYSNAYLLWVVPQGIVTVSLVTALLPRMSAAAAEGDLAGVRADLARGLRGNAVVIWPAALALLALAPQVTGTVFQHGRTGEADVRAMAWILAAFALGLPAFAAQYLLARGFYALGDTRTPFFLNLVIAVLNASLAVASYLLLPARWAVAGMAGGYAVACAVGLLCTVRALSRRLGRWPPTAGLQLRITAAALPGAALAWALAAWCTAALGDGPAGDLAGLLLGGAALAGTVLALAGPLRIDELTGPLGRIAARLGVTGSGRRRRTRPPREERR